MSDKRGARVRPLTSVAIIAAATCLATCHAAAPSTTTTSVLRPVLSRPTSTRAVLAAVAAAAKIQVVPNDIRPPLRGAATDSGQTMAGDAGCNPGFSQTKTPACIFGDPTGAKTLILYGDSHATMWLPAFDALGKRLHWRIALLAKFACSAPELNFWNGESEKPFTQCNTWHKYALARANALHAQVVVVTSQFYTSRLADNIPVTPAEWAQGLKATLADFTTPGIRKVVLGDIPYLAQDGPTCLAAHEQHVQLCSRDATAAVLTAHDDAERSAAAAEGARYLSPVPWLCSSVCTAVVGSMVVNQDQFHLSRTYATYLSGPLQAALKPELDSR